MIDSDIQKKAHLNILKVFYVEFALVIWFFMHAIISEDEYDSKSWKAWFFIFYWEIVSFLLFFVDKKHETPLLSNENW